MNTALKGQHHGAQGWPRFLRPTLGKGFKLMSTLKGLCLDAIPTGLTDDATYPQGRPQKTRSTLGFVTQPRCGCLPGASDCIFPRRFKCINSSHGLWPCNPDRLCRYGELLLGSSRGNREKFGVGVGIGIEKGNQKPTSIPIATPIP